MQPLLSAQIDIDDRMSVSYPVFASLKLDGIRCVTVPNEFTDAPSLPVSRNNKAIPNRALSARLSKLPPHLDGELTVDGRSFLSTTSAVMSNFGDAKDIKFHVFDYWKNPNTPFIERMVALGHIVDEHPEILQMVEQRIIGSAQDLKLFFDDTVSKGFEGIMIREPHAPYKFGRSTVRQGILVKIKPKAKVTARIVGYEQMESNDPGLPPMLGALRVTSIQHGEFNVGTGFTRDQRIEMWSEPRQLLDKVIHVEYQDVGSKNKPRFPSFKGFMEEEE